MNLKIVRMVISMDKKTIKRLLTYCKPYRFLIMLLTLLSIVSVVFTLLTPVLIGQAIDLLVGKNQVHFQALLNKLIFIGIVILIISKTVTTIAIIFVKKIALSLPIFRHLYAQKATISKNIINVTM